MTAQENRRGIAVGALAGLVGIACCVTPTALALLGLASVSFAVSLGNTLYYDYGWYFRAAALALAAAGTVKILRDRRACSWRGAWTFRRLIFIVAVVMITVYSALYALTAWLAQLATRS